MNQTYYQTLTLEIEYAERQLGRLIVAIHNKDERLIDALGGEKSIPETVAHINRMKNQQQEEYEKMR